MTLRVCRYQEQEASWPSSGRHILAQYDAETVVVYQAFHPRIGNEAVRLGRFGDNFSLSRMSWIKPNFLWMMFRCGWATKENQESVLAISLKRPAFDAILNQAVASAFDPALHPSQAEWSAALAQSDVRLQWDPDHAPNGSKCERRAIQLGLRGDVLKHYVSDWIVSIKDITPFVAEQREQAQAGKLERLQTPCETVYPVTDAQYAQLGMAR